MTSTRFILAVHCHQPVGNFDWVFEEAYSSCYRPFLDVVERHPQVPVVFHYTGALIDWIERKHPDFLRRLAAMVKKGQAELLGGGYYEPILAMIPERDALAQLDRMRQTLRRLKLSSNGGPAGAWLAERVWEPQLPSLLGRGGLRYTVVDDAHLEKAGVPEERRFGYYLTEDRGYPLALFPSSKQMRYLVPFKPVEQVIEALAKLRSAEPRTVVLADDGEKFGLWPGTHDWVYKQGWLESFLREIERNRDWLRMTTFERTVEELPPLGRLYLPSGSYEEMLEWSGGFYRNFLAKYPEVDSMHKKMLWVSGRLEKAGLAAKRQAPKLAEAKSHLYMAQANDAYWHGVFGGLYLGHLRHAVYGHLLRAERLADELEGPKTGWARAEAFDVNADWEQEVLLRSDAVTALLDPARGGKLLEFSDKTINLNLLDTLTRRPEAYHEKLRAPLEAGHAAAGDGAPATIHDAQRVPVELLDSLAYDPYRRAGLIDHVLPAEAGHEAFARGEAEEIGDFVDGPYSGQIEASGGAARAVLTRKGSVSAGGRDLPLQITKKVEVVRGRRGLSVSYRIVNAGPSPVTFLFGSETNLALKDAHVNRVGAASGIRRFAVVDPALRLRVSWELSREARLWHFPVETVSDSERGMERTYQGVSLTFLWPVSLSARAAWSAGFSMKLEPADAR